MIKQPAHSALSPGQDDVEELHTGLLQHRRHQYCHSMLDEWATRQNQEGRGQYMWFFLCFFLISISQAGLLPTNCQPFSVYRFTDCLHASRHRRTRSSCLTSPERRDLFFPVWILVEILHLTAEQHNSRHAGLTFVFFLSADTGGLSSTFWEWSFSKGP